MRLDPGGLFGIGPGVGECREVVGGGLSLAGDRRDPGDQVALRIPLEADLVDHSRPALQDQIVLESISRPMQVDRLRGAGELAVAVEGEAEDERKALGRAVAVDDFDVSVGLQGPAAGDGATQEEEAVRGETASDVDRALAGDDCVCAGSAKERDASLDELGAKLFRGRGDFPIVGESFAKIDVQGRAGVDRADAQPGVRALGDPVVDLDADLAPLKSADVPGVLLHRVGTGGERLLQRLAGGGVDQGDEVLLVAAVLARASLPDSARAVLARARRALPADEPIAPYFGYYDAYVATLLGDDDRALELLRAFLAEYPSQREFLPSDWWFRPLWEHPRFRELMATG